jgi:myo-inositol-1(or 4)-monophosphatase
MLNIAIKAARAGGAIINRASLDLDRLTVTSKGHNDFVTEVDQAAERAIIDTLLYAYPNHGILAEETGREHGVRNSEFLWIIDPLDGTTNFIHGLPQYAVSIALAHRGKVEQAVVYDPARNDLFYATKGRGAFLNDKRLRVSKRIRMAEALIGTGFPFRKGDNFKRYLKMFEEVMQACAGVRRPGAAALDLCYVAAGWYDGFFETGLQPWDCAAGSLMITEAGGLVGNFTGEADFLYQREMVAGNPKIYAQLVQMLSEYSRVIKDDEPKPEGDTDAASSQPRAPRVKPAPASTSAIDGTAGSLFANTPTSALARSMAAGIGADMAAAEALQEAAATAAQNTAEQESAEAPARKATRIRKADMPAPEPEAPVRKRAPRDDAPF